MFKSIFTFCTLAGLLFATSVNAQLSFGVKIGVNDATQKLSIDGSLGILGAEADSRIGFNLGAFAEIGSENLRFQPEISFSSKGSIRPGVNDPEADRVHKLSYIEIPLQVKYYFFDNDKFSAYGMGGLSFGYALSGKVDEDGSDEITIEFDDTDNLNYGRVDIGVPLAAGAAMVLGEGKVFVEARYIYGVNKVQKNGDNSTSSLAFNAKNRITQLNVGYIFSF